MYYNFSFNGVEGEDYNVQIGFIDSAPSDEGLVISRTLNDVRQKNTNSFYMTSSTIDEPLVLQIDIIRYQCNDGRYEFTYEEMRSILAWLRSKENGELVIHRSLGSDAHIFGTFYEITEKNAGAMHLGYTMSFRATSPYVFGDEQIETFENRRLFTLHIPRDYYADRDYLCPIIIVTPKTSGDLRISCTDWDEDLELEESIADENITLNSKYELFSSDNSTSNETLYKRFNYVFPLLYTDRTVTSTTISLTTNINCDMTVKYIPLMLPVGIFN